MKTKYIVIVDQDADVDYSEEIKEALFYDVELDQCHACVESVEIVEE